MQRPKLTPMLFGAAAIAAWTVGPALPAQADAAQPAANMQAHAGHSADAPEQSDKDSHEHGDKGEHERGGMGGKCTCGKGGGASCSMHGHGGHEGMQGHGEMGDHEDMDEHEGMHGHMMGHGGMRKHLSMTPEIRYAPSSLSNAGPNGNQFLVLSHGVQFGGDNVFSMGFQNNLAVQLFNPSATTGNWVAPYGGLLPRIGVTLGKLRVDAGVLGGFGMMARTVSQPNGMQFLDTRLQWVVEPRVEIGMKGEHKGLSLVAAYLLTPNPQDMGGISFGLKGTFGPHGW
jgi:hypothetical protein